MTCVNKGAGQLSENGGYTSTHKFLIHKRGDHVGVATSNIRAGEEVAGVFMDDEDTIEVVAAGDIPLGHKIAIAELEADGEVLEYGIPIGRASLGFRTGDYVHTHNIRSARW
jgi:(2R)-sulfolactate sulfo-lyase subunit alpha